MDLNTYIKLKNQGKNIEYYFLQYFIKQGQEKELNKCKPVYDVLMKMCEEEYITENEKGEYEILQDLCVECKKEDWINDLYKEIETTIFNLIKKKNFTPKSGKLFKPALPIFKLKIEKFIKLFKIDDKELISKVLLKYTKDVVTGKVEYPVSLDYICMKNNAGGMSSELLNLIENYEESVKEEKENIIFDGINI